ncbi:hypothetical protein [Streptomyces sp. DSM 41931]|uniref:hypothetical protein n=3 Tax=Streptomyces TaxID=1883 RepID=UPI003D0149D9
MDIVARGYGSSTSSGDGPAGLTDVEPDPDQTIAFLKALYPRLPEGVVSYTTFTVTQRSINVPQRLGTWTAEENNGRPATHDYEWLAARIHRSTQGAPPTPEESAQHFPHVPITGAFLRLPTTMAEWPTGNRRGGQSNVCELVGFVLNGDYDVPGHHKRNENKLPLPPDADTVLDIWTQAVGKAPTLVWTTGGGINGAWLLDTPVRLPDGEEGAALLKQWRAASGRFHDRVVRAANARDMHHDSVPNNDRLMRIPGTVNAKLGVEPKLARLVTTDGPRYSLTDLLTLAPEPVQTDDGSLVDPITGEVLRGPRPVIQGRAAGSARSTSDDGETPWGHYDREIWKRGTFRDLLTRDGWAEEGFHNGVLRFWRPGKGPGEQISATLGANEGVGALSYGAKFFVFSDNAPGLLGTTYKDQFLSPSLYRAVVQHGGDMKASAAELRRSGYGAPRVPAQKPAPTADAWADFQMPTFRPSDYKTVQDAEGNVRRVLTDAAKARITAQMNGETAPDADGETAPEGPIIPGRIPPSFWDRRPVLQHIRQAAHSQCCSSDVFLYAYLARMSALIDHRIRINTGAKQPVCPNIYVGICARSGTNKSSSVAGARDLTYTPEHRDVLDGVPIGTGEGMAEGLMGTVMEDDPDGKTGKDGVVKQTSVRKQVRHNIFFDVDEGETLIRLGSRDGSSLWPSIRVAWTGGPLGQLNATAERNRVIPARSYTISMVVGFQYSNVLKVIQDDETGTAQRFIWCNAVDPDIPMDPVDWPGECRTALRR